MSRLNADNVLAPAGRPEALVLLLHGVGASGADLMPLAEALADSLPNVMFIAPNAPDPYDGGPPDFSLPDAYQWFSLEGITLENREERVRKVAPVLDTFIDEQLREHKLDDSKLVLVGFSQGTIMALLVALQRERACAGILGYSGRLAGATGLPNEIIARPPVLLIHGELDSVIPIDELYAAEAVLRSCNVPVQAVAMPRLGHTISEAGEKLGEAFLDFCLNESVIPKDLKDFSERMGLQPGKNQVS